MDTVFVTAHDAAKRLREWVDAMDLDDLALALSELSDYEDTPVVVGSESSVYCSEPHKNGRRALPRKRRSK